jgi:hypothetical protein
MTTERLLPPQRERWKMATADTHLLLSRDIDLYYGFLGANQPLISDVFLYEHKLYNSPTPTAAIGSLETGLKQGRGVVIVHLSISARQLAAWQNKAKKLSFLMTSPFVYPYGGRSAGFANTWWRRSLLYDREFYFASLQQINGLSGCFFLSWILVW